jgi:hypothetical protein
MEFNKWMKKFKVSSRIKDKYVPSDRVRTISKMYDFSKLVDVLK